MKKLLAIGLGMSLCLTGCVNDNAYEGENITRYTIEDQVEAYIDHHKGENYHLIGEVEVFTDDDGVVKCSYDVGHNGKYVCNTVTPEWWIKDLVAQE